MKTKLSIVLTLFAMTVMEVLLTPSEAQSNAIDAHSPVISPMGVMQNPIAIAAGYQHTCALTSDGGVKCWGYNAYGQLGDGGVGTPCAAGVCSLTPMNVSVPTNLISMIAPGEESTCALTTSGGVKCWGYNASGEVGDGTLTDRSTPVDVCADSSCTSTLSGVTAIAAGDKHACALIGGGVKCWGQNNGMLGDGTMTDRHTPVDVSGLTSGVSQIVTEGWHTCALMLSGGVKCWGNNFYGQLGNGTTTTVLTPVDVCADSSCTSTLSGVSAIFAGLYHTCALMFSGSVKCWGYNGYGQLGDGTTTDRYMPVDVTVLNGGVSAIAAGYRHTCALMSSGGVKCWGDNARSQLGNGTTTGSLTAVNVCADASCSNNLSGVIAFTGGGGYHTCVLTGSGAKCWGYNADGELGDGTATDRSTPVGVVGLSGGFAISGQVTDSGSNPVSGVTISDGIGDTATTDSNGNYTLSGLAAGTYTVTPTMSGYTFSPTALIATVPPNATGQNFIGCPASVIPWTVMVYLDGDQNGILSLDSNYFSVFNQYESVANNPCVNIVVAWDRSGSGKDAYYKVKYDTNLNQLANYTEGADMWTPSPSELDMSNPTTLSNFITWARTNFPAQHYALIISDHGTGLNGTALDSTTGSNAWLTIMNLGNALATATSNGANKIDVIFADSCFMAMTEDAYQIQNYASYYVASENEIFIPPNGVSGPYTNYISSITASISPHDFANAIVTQYANWMNNTYPSLPYTLSAVDLGQVSNLVSSVNSLASSINSQMGTYASQVSSAREATQKFDSNWDYLLNSQDQYVDLYDFASQISNRISDPTIQSEAQTVMNATNGYVINNVRLSGKYKGNAWNLNNSHGVSVFFPPNASSFYNATRYDFAVGAVWPGHAPTRRQPTQNVVNWGPMLVSYFQITQPGGPDTPNPPNLAAPLSNSSSIFLPFIRK